MVAQQTERVSERRTKVRQVPEGGSIQIGFCQLLQFSNRHSTSCLELFQVLGQFEKTGSIF